MDAQENVATRVLGTFAATPIAVGVIENPDATPTNHEPQLVVRITVKDEAGDLDKMLTLCVCHAREFADLLEKAANYAESQADGAEA